MTAPGQRDPNAATVDDRRRDGLDDRLYATGLGAAGVVLAVLAQPLIEGLVYISDDLASFHLPWRAFYAQSLARGTPSTEVDYLSGEIARLGRAHGVPTPINITFQRVVRELAHQHSAPGTLSPRELRARIDAQRG